MVHLHLQLQRAKVLRRIGQEDVVGHAVRLDQSAILFEIKLERELLRCTLHLERLAVVIAKKDVVKTGLELERTAPLPDTLSGDNVTDSVDILAQLGGIIIVSVVENEKVLLAPGLKDLYIKCQPNHSPHRSNMDR